MATRTKIFSNKVTGKILEWKGKFGWIQPDKPIDHPDARKKGGKVYLGVEDVEDEIEGIGSLVSFFVYADGSGLGAMNCKPHNGKPMLGGSRPAAPAPRALPPKPVQSRPAPPARPPPQSAKGAGKGGKGKSKDYKPTEKTRVSDDEYFGKIKVFRNKYGFIFPNEPIEHELFKDKLYFAIEDCEPKELVKAGAEVSFVLYTDAQGLGAECVNVTAEAPEGAAEEEEAKPPRKPLKKPSPPDTAPPAGAQKGGGQKGGQKRPAPEAGGKAGKRQRVSELELTGEVVEWKGKFGWISPYDVVDHPAAKKRDGKIHVAAADIQNEEKTLNEGQLVQFHVFVNAEGLGAENVQPF